MIYDFFFIKVSGWSENSVRFENLMGIGFQKGQTRVRYGMYNLLIFFEKGIKCNLYRAYPGSECVVANTFAKWKKLEPNKMNYKESSINKFCI